MRIFVFRPESDAQRTAQAIVARGHEPILAPLFTLVALPQAAPEGPFAAIVLTSSNAVPALAQGPAIWREGPVFTVGARTAEAVRAAGFSDARSAGGDRHDLLDLIKRNLPAGARLLMIVGRDRHEDLPQRLAEAGFEVEILIAYAAEPVSMLPKAAAKAIVDGEVDAALHYSTRGAETFVRLAGAVHLAEEAMALTHVALSAEVAGPLIAAGARTVLVAEHPEEAALLAALDQVSARQQVSARNRGMEDATHSPIAPPGVETDKDAMGDADIPAKPPSRSRRIPPTLEARAREIADPVAETGAQTLVAAASAPVEAILPTEAPPQEFAPAQASPEQASSEQASSEQASSEQESSEQVSPAPQETESAPELASAPPQTSAPQTSAPHASATQASAPHASAPHASAPQTSLAESSPPRRSLLPAMALAGIVGGVIGAGLALFAMSRTAPAVSAEDIAALRGQIEVLRGQTALAAKAGADAQAATLRATEAASAQRAQLPDAGAIAGLSDQAKRAEAAAAAIGQRLDQASARIGSVESLAKSAAAPSPQALAAARIVLAERIQIAIASGQPFAGDVAALAKGGGAPEQIAALNAVAATGAPTQAVLLAQFKSHAAMFARETTPGSANWQDRLLGLASRVVTIRPIDGKAADDASTLTTRLENAIAAGRTGAAATLWDQLPEPARQASADFGASLRKRAAADAAIAKIAQDAVAALGAAG